MSLLDANADDLQTAATNSRWSPAKPVEPGAFNNVGSTAGNYFMRSMAEVARSASMAAAVVPIAIDKVAGQDNYSGKSLTDRYFEFHDEVFGSAVDYWTPRPEETGKVGQVIGSLGGGIVQFLASPGLAVANAQLSTSEDLVRQGVDADAALLAGDVAGIGTVVGMALPVVGKNLGQRVGTGVAGNLGQGVATAAATQQILDAGGASPQVQAQFDPFDPTARGVDALLGAVFGVKAHVDAPRLPVTQTQRDALLLLKQSQHLEEVGTPGRPATEADLVAAVDGVRTAIDQMVRGEPVAVADMPRFDADDVRVAERAEIAEVVAAEMPAPDHLPRPEMLAPESAAKPEAAQPAAKAAEGEPDQAAPRFDESVRLPTGEFDPKTGEPITVSANDFIARASEEAAQTKTTARNLYAAAAECLLGSI